MTKFCSKCGKVKVLELFYKRKLSKDGFFSICKECDYQRQVIWTKNNPEKVAAAKNKYRKNNPEKVAAARKKWEKNNPEKNARYRIANPEKRAAIRIKYRKNNPEKTANYGKLYTERLTDCYITSLLGIKNPPQELMELKRVQILITRELRNKPCQL